MEAAGRGRALWEFRTIERSNSGAGRLRAPTGHRSCAVDVSMGQQPLIRETRSLERAEDCGLPKGDDLAVLPINKSRSQLADCQGEVTD